MSTAFILLVAFLIAAMRYLILKKWYHVNEASKPLSIGFLHPHALSGGGGERVLWTAVLAASQRFPSAQLVLYSIWVGRGPQTAMEDAKRSANRHFGIDLTHVKFDVVDISDIAHLVESSRYPRMTLVLQALGGIALGLRAYVRQPTDIFIDTANITFALVGPHFLNARTMAYVHYPTISTDMLTTVFRRETGVHNNEATSQSAVRTIVKLIYYHLFAIFYAVASWFIDDAVANSSWTAAHLRKIWRREVDVIFPPCKVDLAIQCDEKMNDVASSGIQSYINSDAKREDGVIVSVGQFRPEKRHHEQLEIMQRVIAQVPDVKLVMIGGARDDRDRQRATDIRDRVALMRIPAEVRLNAVREDLATCLAHASVGLHTMRFEHFGIGVVELMVAGVIVVAHRSGGVMTDIICDGDNGFLADDETQFADAVIKILRMEDAERRRLRKNALASCTKFSERAFCTHFVHVLEASVNKLRYKRIGM